MEWINIEDQSPICYEEGDWDGLRSEVVLLFTINAFKEESFITARMYSGTMDGSKFADFYSEDDFEVNNVVQWCVITHPTG